MLFQNIGNTKRKRNYSMLNKTIISKMKNAELLTMWHESMCGGYGVESGRKISNFGRDEQTMLELKAIIRQEILSRMNDTSDMFKEQGDKISPTLKKVMEDQVLDNRMLASFMFLDEPKNYIRMYKDVKAMISVWIAFLSTGDADYKQFFEKMMQKMPKESRRAFWIYQIAIESNMSNGGCVEAEVTNDKTKVE